MKRIIHSLLACTVLFAPSYSYAVDAEAVKKLYNEKLASWLNSDTVVQAIELQNTQHASLTQIGIDNLDAQWRSGDESLISTVLSNDLSIYLQGIVTKGEGLYTEVFVMDNKGLNVGQSAKTSDYWQGDEAKFQDSFGKGVDAIHISDVEFDESTQTYQVQVSVTISKDGTPIGAATIGLDAEAIE